MQNIQDSAGVLRVIALSIMGRLLTIQRRFQALAKRSGRLGLGSCYSGPKNGVRSDFHSENTSETRA